MSRQYKRRKYLIDPRFQIKWTLFITLAGGITAAVFSAALWGSINEQDELLNKATQADRSLAKKSKDIVVLLLNMPEITAKEEKKREKEYAEIQAEEKKAIAAKKALVAHNRKARCLLLGSVALISLCLFVWGVFLTHRVAGPLFVLRRHFQDMQKDGKVHLRPLRKSDEFQALYKDACDVIKRVSEKDVLDNDQT